MKPIPSHILGELKRYDPLLNLRWSREKRQFVLERRVNLEIHNVRLEKPVIYRNAGNGKVREVVCPEYSERYIQYRSGTLPIAFFSKLDRRLFWWIYSHDSYRMGMGKKFVDKLEEKERKAEKLQDEKDSAYVRDLSSEAYDDMKRKAGERISFHG